MNYKEELTKAMSMLGKHKDTIFVGQGVEYDGQAAFSTFSGVPDYKKLEMPVAEDFQMGFCIGMALEGFIPVSFYPRFDFLLLAMNQLVNHLDKIPEYSDFRPKMIIRTAVGAKEPLDAGPQHTQDHSRSLSMMMRNVNVVRVKKPEHIDLVYREALESKRPTVVVEYMEKY